MLLLSSTLLLLMGGCESDDPDARAERDRRRILDYIAENDLDAMELEQGVFVVLEIEGIGPFPTEQSLVKISYTGRLLKGDVFEQRDEATMTVGSGVRGFQLGLVKFNRGAKGMILIPSGMGYGDFPMASIPRNSVLIFDIEMIDFIN